jgi:Ca2+-binding RTX toxin-like protein
MATINGSSGNDFLNGTAGADTIYGHEGIDEIKGGKGNDLLLGGDGDDAIDGGEGSDRIDGGAGNDNLGGGGFNTGNDSIVGGAGDDVIGGGLGNDTLDGGDGNDFFFRQSGGTNRIFGGAGNDTYSGGADNNIVDGGSGDDVFLLEGHDNAGTATLTGGAGRDLYVLRDVVPSGPGGLKVNVIIDFKSGAGGDQLDLDELLTRSGEFFGYEGGNPFNSAIRIFRFAQSGADTLFQWNNKPSVNVSDQWETVYRLKNLSASTLTADNIVGGIPPNGSAVPGGVHTGTAGSDSLQGGFFDDAIAGLDGGDLLDGRGGNDSIDGGAGNDTIVGGPGNDKLFGGSGDDLFVVDSAGTGSQASGGAGIDTYRLEIGLLKLNRGYTVTDFAAGAGGDLIDVNPLLIHSIIPYGTQPLTFGYTGGNPFATDFLRWVQSGADVKLQWDSDGPDDNLAGWQTVLTLENLQVADLTVDNMVSWIPPDGSTTAGRTITGTGGNDQLLGGIFADHISGLDGADQLTGNSGSDVVDGAAGDDTLDGGLGNDTLYGGDGTDRLGGNIGNDWAYGGAGDDEFGDVFGNNRLYGEDGNDSFRLGSNGAIFWSGADTVTGGAGSDVYWIQVDMNRLVSVKDRVTDFAAGPGGDLLDLRNLPIGHDVFASAFDLGHLRLFQSGANTLLQFDLDGADGGFERITLLTLQNVTASSITSDNFAGELVVGTAGDDALFGGLGHDTVQGLAGNDTLDGSLGTDTLEGGSGDDLYYVDNIADAVVEESNAAPGALLLPGGGPGLAGPAGITDTVIAAVNYAIGQFIENLTLSGGASRATGNELANKLTGNAGADILNGGGGNDTLDGGSGNDRLLGGDGNDSLVWGTGDRIDGGAGTDTLKMTSGNLNLATLANDRILNVETINMTGGGNNILTLTGDDVLDMSSTDTLKILGNPGDVLNLQPQLTVEGAAVSGFRTYTLGAATLLVDIDVMVVF